MDAIRAARLNLGVDPLGGAGARLLGAHRRPLQARPHLVNPSLDPTFAFMTVDQDGKIRMDCSCPYAMAGLVAPQGPLRPRLRQRPRRRPPRHRHPVLGLMNPNHYLAVAIHYLFTHRPGWPAAAVVARPSSPAA